MQDFNEFKATADELQQSLLQVILDAAKNDSAYTMAAINATFRVGIALVHAGKLPSQIRSSLASLVSEGIRNQPR